MLVESTGRDAEDAHRKEDTKEKIMEGTFWKSGRDWM